MKLHDKRLTPIAHILTILSAFCLLIFAGCEIEEAENDQVITTGHVIVTTQTPEGGEIVGADILLDGSATGKTTPDTLFEIEAGQHSISVTRLGLMDASQDIDVVAENVITATIEMTVDYGSEVGKTAIDFTLPSVQDSTLYTLSDCRGKVTFVSFYFNNCAPCLEEFPHIQETWEDPRFTDKIQFFGVNGQDPWQTATLYLVLHPDLGITFPLLHDATQQVRSGDYNVTSHPANFLIDQNGVIRYRWGSITEQLLFESIQTLLAESDE